MSRNKHKIIHQPYIIGIPSYLYLHSSNNMHSSNYIYSNKNDQSNQVLESNQNQNNRQNKWVINISSKPLTPDEEKLLAHGPNYDIVPRNPPIVQYVAAVEHACNRLEEGKVEESGFKSRQPSKRSENQNQT